MFCPQCGVEVAESATFCRKCGAPMRDGVTRPVAAEPPQTMRHTLGATKPAQPIVGVFAIAGAALAMLGAVLPWVDISGATANGFDGGYLTGSSMGDGNDGIVIVLLALAAAAIAVHYFFGRNKMAAVGVIVLGAGLALVAAYNLERLISDIRDMCNGCNAMSYVGMGLYAGIAGGAIAAGAAFIGLKRGAST